MPAEKLYSSHVRCLSTRQKCCPYPRLPSVATIPVWPQEAHDFLGVLLSDEKFQAMAGHLQSTRRFFLLREEILHELIAVTGPKYAARGLDL